MDQKTHTHTNTHSKQTALPAEWNHEATKVTSDIKADQQNFKGAPGKALWKNPSRKMEHRENGSTPSHTSCCTAIKHGQNKNNRRPRCCVGSKGYLLHKKNRQKCMVMQTMNYLNESSKGTFSANT